MKKENIILAAILVAVLGFFGVQFYTSTPEYVAKKEYASAQALLESGQVQEALTLLKKVTESETSIAQTARDAILSLSADSGLSAEQKVLAFEYAFPYRQFKSNFAGSLEAAINELQPQNPIQAGQLAVLLSDLQETEEEYLRYRQQAYELLSAQMDNLTTLQQAEAFALLDEAFNECKNCPAVLDKYRDSLGHSEAARALGQYYARVNEVELSFQLLQPYTDEYLGQYRAAESQYQALSDAAWDETIEYLNSNKAPESFYIEYENADEAGQNQLVNEMYTQRLQNNKRIMKAWEQYQSAAAIVPVALDLGIVRLTRATSMTDSAARQKELSAAESMFLSVKSYAGDTDEYQLYLGQVYYWLGKAEDGDALFDELINKYQRSDAVLGSIARVLRDLGAEGKAKQYTEEAYEKADEEGKKEHAYQLYLLASELDERVEWLEKSDKSQVWVQADLYSAKANLAERDGEEKKAADLYQKSIDTYLSMAEGQYSYNNIALIYMAKYRLLGNESDYDAALSNMDKAVQMAPDDRIVLTNAADYYSTKTFRTFLKNKFDFDVLRYSPSSDLVQYLYNSDAEKQKIIGELSNLSSYPKMLEYTKKSALLAPKNRKVFSNTLSTFSFFRLEEDIFSLANRLDDISLENIEYLEYMTEYRSGAQDEEELESLAKGIADFKEKYKDLSAKNNPLEYLVVSSDLINASLQRYSYGDFYDVSSELKIAEGNYQNRPSSATLGVYREVLIHDIIYQLRRQSADFKQFHDEYFRIYSNGYLVSMAKTAVADFGQAIASVTSAKKLAQLIKDSEARFPYNPSFASWSLLLAFEDPFAREIQKSYAKSSIAGAYEKIGEHTQVNEEERVYSQYLSLKIKGQDAQAKQTLQKAAEKQLHIPQTLLL